MSDEIKEPDIQWRCLANHKPERRRTIFCKIEPFKRQNEWVREHVLLDLGAFEISEYSGPFFVTLKELDFFNENEFKYIYWLDDKTTVLKPVDEE